MVAGGISESCEPSKVQVLASGDLNQSGHEASKPGGTGQQMLALGFARSLMQASIVGTNGKVLDTQVTDTLGKLLREGPVIDVAREYFVHLFFCSFGDYLGYSSWAIWSP